MNKKYIIRIYMVNGAKDEWRSDEWDHYKLVDNLFFVVIKNKIWIGFYPIKYVYRIIVREDD